MVSVSNPADINNAVARAELQITYAMKNGVSAICRIQHNPALGGTEGDGTSAASLLSLALRIDAHQTVSGWFVFGLDNEVIREGTVDAHRLILEDTHGVLTETESIMVREWTDESQEA